LFRIKITLLSVFVSGAVLVAFGIFFMTVVNRVHIDRIDREIQTLGESQLHDWHPRKDWQGFERSLRSIYGQERWEELIVHVIDADHRVLYRSPHWPKEIGTNFFPEFDVGMETFPVPHGNNLRPPPRGIDGENRAGGDFIRNPLPGGPPIPPPPPGEKTTWPIPPPQDTHPGAHIKKPVFKTLETASGTWRTGIMGSQYVTLLLGMNMAGFYEDAGRYRNAFFISIPLALLLLACGGWLVAHRALKPVADITRTARSITVRGLNQRIITTGPDTELSQLARVINDMLDRLEKSFSQAVRFSADAAHELQTPLTVLQGNLDNAVQSAPFGSEEQKRCSRLLEEVSRLKNIVRKLLILARADAGQLVLNPIPVDMSRMVESAAEDAEVIGPHLKIEMKIRPGITVRADSDLLRMVIQDLTTNAVKYNIDKGLIRFDLRVKNGNAILLVSNTGPQIPDEACQRIFDRFYRVDKSRNSNTPGTGLGLSLAWEIVNAHNGKIGLESLQDNLTVFSLTLPVRGAGKNKSPILLVL